MDIVSLDQFQSFFYAKGFDIIGDTAFKRHLTMCKDANDAWAIKMWNDVQYLQSKIRDLQNLVQEIPNTPCRMFELCRDVMSNARPPTQLFSGIATCVLTGLQCSPAIDLSKIHRNQRSSIFVHTQFSHFFLFLWYTNKIEYIIRSYTRNWLDSKPEETNKKILCDMLQSEMQDTIAKMHRLFVLAYNHVTKSLEQLVTVQLQTPVLR